MNDSKNKSAKPVGQFFLEAVFDDGQKCICNVEQDINQIKSYKSEDIPGLFQQVRLDTSRTCYWNDR